MRSFFLSLLCTALTAGLVTLAVGPAREALIHRVAPAELGLTRPPTIRQDLEERAPRLVLMGNSVMDAGVHGKSIEDSTRLPTVSAYLHGSASALWYLLTKNVLVGLERKPEVLVLGFRDVYLTEPDYRTRGAYKKIIDFYADENEPLLDLLGYLNKASELEMFAVRHWSVWQQRGELREATEALVKRDLVPAALRRITGSEPEPYEEVISRVFHEKNKIPELVNAAQIAAELMVEPHQFDFQTRLEQSFLPEIIRLTREAGIRLVLVRLPNRRTYELADTPELMPDWSTDLLPTYMADLAAYLEAEGVDMLDFDGDPRIEFDWFKAGDHIRPGATKSEFTMMVLERLRPLLPPAAPR